jgi:hypothetical protein
MYKTNQPSSSVVVTPSDSTDLSDSIVNGIWVGGTGNITFRLRQDGADRVMTAVPAGTYIPGNFRLIKAATTATLILGFGPAQ